MNTKFVLGLPKAKQVGLEHVKKTQGGVSAGVRNPPPPGMSMLTDSMVFLKASLTLLTEHTVFCRKFNQSSQFFLSFWVKVVGYAGKYFFKCIFGQILVHFMGILSIFTCTFHIRCFITNLVLPKITHCLPKFTFCKTAADMQAPALAARTI